MIEYKDIRTNVFFNHVRINIAFANPRSFGHLKFRIIDVIFHPHLTRWPQPSDLTISMVCLASLLSGRFRPVYPNAS